MMSEPAKKKVSTSVEVDGFWQKAAVLLRIGACWWFRQRRFEAAQAVQAVDEGAVRGDAPW